MPKSVAVIALFLSSVVLASEPVPEWLIRLPETTPVVFVAETSAYAFHRFDRAGDSVKKVRQDYMSIGEGGVGKRAAGDQRTPLGVYFVIEQLDTTRLHEKYGAMAFPLDYPNVWDRRHGRTGDGIWIHGVDRRGGVRPPLDTDGCIALPNDRLSSLVQWFEPNVTPVLIAEDMAWSEADAVAEVRGSLEQAIARWARGLEQGDMYTYLEAYDDSFRHWGMNKDEWSAFSMETVGHRPISRVEVSDLLLLGDPVEPGLYLSRFRLKIEEEEARSVITVRRIYWRRSESGAFRIVAEDSG
ncbi:MAG: L,D-transpeptidase family protein [Gammaproteobacteria bacterium]|nr:L,D-transpeptidase family protein [Gammaproteobacteria bacterium]